MSGLRFPLRALAFVIVATNTLEGASGPLRASRQCLVVIAQDWDSQTGTLRAFERRGSRENWEMRGRVVPVVLGKKGLAWGVGLLGEHGPGPRKVEGDNRVPAGIFRVGPAFGYAPAHAARWIKLKYTPLTEQTEGVDDVRSRYYNRLVERSKVHQVDWGSSEQMRRKDNLYKWGLVVGHNPAAIPGAGSCIFLHIWKNPHFATTGCTAMPERDLVDLLRWLDPAAHPVLIQMPLAEFAGLRARYALPSLP